MAKLWIQPLSILRGSFLLRFGLLPPSCLSRSGPLYVLRSLRPHPVTRRGTRQCAVVQRASAEAFAQFLRIHLLSGLSVWGVKVTRRDCGLVSWAGLGWAGQCDMQAREVSGLVAQSLLSFLVGCPMKLRGCVRHV